MESIIRAVSVSPRADDKNRKALMAVSSTSAASGDLHLQDLGFNKSELEEKISIHEMTQADLMNLDKRRELSLSQGNQEENKEQDRKRFREQSPSPAHVMPSLLLFSPTPRKTVATITPSEKSRNNADSPHSVLRLGSLRLAAGNSSLGSLRLGAGNSSSGSPNFTPSADVSRFQSVWKFDDQGKMVRADSNPAEAPLTRDLDLIKSLTEGTVLLKFGAKGQPHFRYFVLNSKLDTLLWMSGTKNFESTRIPLASINDIKFGLGDKGLKIKGAKVYQNLGFTIVYNDWENTLELMAKDSEELQIWVNGLIALHNASRNGEPAPQSVIMAISTNVEQHILFGKSVNGGAQATPTEVSKLEKKFNRLAELTEVVVVPFADIVTERIAAGIRQLKEEVANATSIANLNYQLWLMAVQVDALQHILRTPRETTPRPVLPVAQMEVDD